THRRCGPVLRHDIRGRCLIPSSGQAPASSWQIDRANNCASESLPNTTLKISAGNDFHRTPQRWTTKWQAAFPRKGGQLASQEIVRSKIRDVLPSSKWA